MSQKIIVMGSNSFSGSHFVNRALERGMEVVGMSRSKESDPVFLPYCWKKEHKRDFSFFQMDLNHDLKKIMEIVYDFRPGYVVNFASQSMVAQSWENPGHWYQTNTLSTILFHDQLRRCKFIKKYLHVSTPEVYGSCSGSVKESHHYNPSTPYAVSRAAADMSLKTFFESYQFPVVYTRAANVYGQGQQLYRIIPRAILFFMLGKKLSLHGGGTSVRSFIHINDVVVGTLEVLLKGVPGEIYHLSYPRLISIKDLTFKIAELLGTDFESHVEIAAERLGKDFSYSLDYSKARDQLGWEPVVEMEKGLDETIHWVKDNINILKELPFDYTHKA